MPPLRLLLPLFAILCPFADAAAQWPSELRPDVRIQVTVPEAQYQHQEPRGLRLRGRLAQLSADTLYLRVADSLSPLAIPRGWIRHVAISRGVPTRVASAARQGFLWGAIGALEFAGIFAIANSSDLSAGEAALVGGGLGLALGSTFGALYPAERWHRLQIAPTVRASGSPGASLNLRLSW
jgi:hypothetical protein